ncbi:MAG: nucleotide exchange factor GrpE [Chloroflexota bacterium]|nr:nucleotide exchange factor GrpE [Chloroflexota bacterium]
MSDSKPHPSEAVETVPEHGSDGTTPSPAPPDNPDLEGQTTPQMVSIEQLDAAQAQAKQYMDGWQRERAEFANFKRRTERERTETYQNASADVIKLLLPIIDDFERAMANLPADLVSNPWVSGVGMVGRKFERLLENFNVKAVDPLGDIFDPSLHEAISMEDSTSVESGRVIETLQRGYLVGERVLRPAMVRIAR